ncbi:MAG: hypothetical protein IJI54_15135 [Kiritimatiellae bacterium]|nr:hypothetical protein [Kiritimatiellia bacterium]
MRRRRTQASRILRSGAKRRPTAGGTLELVTSFTADKCATLVVSWLKNGNTDYLVVLNRDPNDDTDFTATFAPRVKLVRRDGTLADAGSYANFFWLEPGDVAVFAAP